MATGPAEPARVAVVTGGASGLGLAISRNLARDGFHVVIVGRDPLKLARTADALNRALPEPRVSWKATTDLTSLAEVRRVGAELVRDHPRISLLVNNAGAVFDRRELTEDGVERTFALNVLAPFLLTAWLLPSLKNDGRGRVVNIASAAHRGQHLDFSDLMLARQWGRLRAYGRSKLALILLTRALARRLSADPVTMLTVHPGVVRTRWGHNLTGPLGAVVRVGTRLAGVGVERGAITPTWASTEPSLVGKSGSYFARRRERRGSRASQDLETAERLLIECSRLAGGVLPDPSLERKATAPAPG